MKSSQLLLHSMNRGMDAPDVDLLDAVGVPRPGNANLHIGHARECTSIVAGQSEHAHAQRFGLGGCREHVGSCHLC